MDSLSYSATPDYPSAEEILSRCGFHKGVLNQECPNDTRIEVALKLDDWKLMGRQGFRFEKCEVSSIDEDSTKSVEMKRIALMDTWAWKHGKDASYLNLAQALDRIDRRDLVYYLCELMNYTHSSKEATCKKRDHESSDVPPTKMPRTEGSILPPTTSEFNKATAEDTNEDIVCVFQCPCRKCTLESYLVRGCDKSQYTFPFLEMSELTQDDKVNATQILINDVKDIVTNFSDLSLNTIDSLIRRMVTVDRLKNVVFSVSNDMSLNDELNSATTIDAAFCVLGKHWSFFNYDILERIIIRLGDEKDKESLFAFREKFRRFCKHKIFDVAPNSYSHQQGYLRKGRQSFVLVAEKSMLQYIGDVKEAQHKIATLLGIKSAQLRIHRIDQGSIILVVSVPDDIAQTLFPLSNEKIAELRREGFDIFVPERLISPEAMTQCHDAQHDTDSDDDDPEKQHPATIEPHTEGDQTFTDDVLSTHNDYKPEKQISMDQAIDPVQELPTHAQTCADDSELNCFKCKERLPNPYSISTCCEAKFCLRCISEIQGSDALCPCCQGFEFEFVSVTDSELQLMSQKKYYTCPNCNNYTSTYEDVEANHLPICPRNILITCNQCGKPIQRQDYDDHIAKYCPSSVVDCPYKVTVGCQERLPRKELFFHLLKHSHLFQEAYQCYTEAKEVQETLQQSKEAGFDCDFVKKFDRELFQTKCPVCRQILRQPYEVSCCGNSFCSFCIKQVKLYSKLCPLCKCSQYKFHHNKGLERFLYQLHVYCTNISKGCEWQGELRDLDKHINSNPSHSTQLNGCEFAIIRCIFCLEEFQRCSIDKHQSKQCLKRSISCPLNCGKEFQHNNLEHHLRTDCHGVATGLSPSVSIKGVFRWIGSDEFEEQEILLLLRYSMDSKMWNCNETNDDADTVLHLACKANRCLVVESLLTNMKSNPNVVNKEGKAPIQLTNDLSIINQLIQYEARFSTEDVMKWTKQFGLPKVAEVITLNDPDRRTTEGHTALHIACISNKPDVVNRLLVEKHCHPDVKNCDEKTAIELTLNHKVTEVLVKNNATITSKLVVNWLMQEDRNRQQKLIESIICVHPNFKTIDGDSVLHLICKHGSSHIVGFLLNVYIECDPNIEDNEGKTPIQVTPKSCLDTIEVLIARGAITNSDIIFTLICNESCDIQIFRKSLNNTTWKHDRTDHFGNTALHLACEHNILKIANILLSETESNPNKENGAKKTPFQLCKDSDIMRELIKYGAILQSNDIVYLISCRDIVSPDKIVSVLQFAIERESWNPQDLLSNGDSLLHVACQLNMCELVDYLLSEVKSNPNTKNFEEKAPIVYTRDIKIIKELVHHNAVTSSREVFMLVRSTTKESEGEVIDLLRTLLQHTTWSPDDKTSEGDTVLHLACNVNSPVVVDFLLSEANCDPNVPNAHGILPHGTTSDPQVQQLLVSYGTKTDILYKIMPHHKELGTNKPLTPPVKIFVVGDPFAGKSTLIAALQGNSNRFWSKRVSNVPSKTIGVIPYDFDSKMFGPVTFYDFAGQREFYSSHAALLQITVQQSSAPIFILVVNLSDGGYGHIRRSMYYWFSFLENQCTLVEAKPKIIVVGSHTDVMKSTFVHKKFAEMCSSYPFVNLDFIEFVAMDCQCTKSAGMSELQHHLSIYCSKLRIKENIPFNAHWFYAYLSNIRFTFGKLGNILEGIKNANDDIATRYIPQSLGALYKICLELNDRGHILFLKHPNEAENSWIVFDKNTILSNVVGTIFAPENFPDHKFLASSTGVVPLSKLKTHFPQFNSAILIGFLAHLEFCHEISDQELVHCISKQYSPTSGERYYLFPGLIAQDNDCLTREMDDIDCGWILKCKKSYQFFDSRFLQVLLLRLAFTLTLFMKDPHKEIPALQRNCFLWKNGIFWKNEFNVKVLVEVSSDSKAVILLMQHISHSLLHSTKLQARIIQKVFQCVKENCPCVQLAESLIIPHSPIQYPLKNLSDQTLISVEKVARTAIRPYLMTANLEKLPLFEPYIHLGADLISTLMNPDIVNEVISYQSLSQLVNAIATCKPTQRQLFLDIFGLEPNVYNILEVCDLYDTIHQALQESQQRDGYMWTYWNLRQKLEQYSIFSGRSVLDVAELESSLIDGHSYDPEEWSRSSDTDSEGPDDESRLHHKRLSQYDVTDSSDLSDYMLI